MLDVTELALTRIVETEALLKRYVMSICRLGKA